MSVYTTVCTCGLVDLSKPNWCDACDGLVTHYFDLSPCVVEEGPPTMTTYKRVDGELICGEFGFVGELEWFEDDDEPTELIKEVWIRQSIENVTGGPA